MNKVTLKQKLKVYIVNPFLAKIDENEVIDKTEPEYLVRWLNHGNIEMSNFNDADVIVFTPGSNINPALYNQKPINGNDYNNDRDVNATIAFKKAVKAKKFMIGIDRGAIFLTALNNGSVIQYVNHHNVLHKMKDVKTGTIFEDVSSNHTQMMFPYNLHPQSYEILAFSKKSNFAKKPTVGFQYLVEERAEKVHKRTLVKYLDDFMEPEMVYYPRTGGIAMQFNCCGIYKDNTLITYVNNQILEKYLAFQTNKLLKTNNNEETDRNPVLELGGWIGD